jgi:hypothetical protein
MLACWAPALYDTAENLGEVGAADELGNVVTEAYVREVALCAKAEGTSTCLCHEDDEFYAARPELRPALVAIEVAARYYGFANDLLEADDAAAEAAARAEQEVAA